MDLLIGVFFFLLVVILIIAIERIFNRYLKLYLTTERTINGRKVQNYIIYPMRIILGLLLIYSFFLLVPLPKEFLLGISLIIGSAITLASYHSIQNYTSGIFILLSKPFKVNDIIEVNGIVGKVEKITLNYVKLKTIEKNYLVIPNKQINKTMITSFDEKSFKKSKDVFYKKDDDDNDKIGLKHLIFSLSIPILPPSEIHSKINKVVDNFTDIFGYRPSFMVYSLSNKINYKFTITSNNPDILLDHFFEFRNSLLKEFY